MTDADSKTARELLDKAINATWELERYLENGDLRFDQIDKALHQLFILREQWRSND